jgi:hypothetical protein
MSPTEFESQVGLAVFQTGCRPDVVKRKDGYLFVIVEGKTKAAAREVPVHSSVNHVLERRARAKGTVRLRRSHTWSIRSLLTPYYQGIWTLPEAGRRC